MIYEIHPSLTQQWLIDDGVVKYDLTEINPDVMFRWAKSIIEILENWDDRQPCCLLFNLTHPKVSVGYVLMTNREIFNIGITRTGQNDVEQILRARPDLHVRVALVVSSEASGRIAQRFSRESGVSRIQGKVYFDEQAAIDWLQGEKLPDRQTRVLGGSSLDQPARIHARDGNNFYVQRERIFLLVNERMEELHFQEDGTVIIGRSDARSGHRLDLDLSFYGEAAQSVSRQHARLVVHKGQLYIEDLDSTNGTYLSGQRLRPGTLQAVRSNDMLHLGEVMVTVVAEPHH